MVPRRCIRRRSRIRCVGFLLAWLIVVSFRTETNSAVPYLYSPWFVNAQPPACSDGSIGYDTIRSLNIDIDSEVSRIVGGGQPESAYIYRLCPESRFELEYDQSLIPKLDGSVFQCGDGSPGLRCSISGGRDQILLNRRSELSDKYPMNEIQLVGLTFSGFKNSLVSGSASASTTVTVVNCTISNASSRYVFDQSGEAADQEADDSGQTFSVNVFDSTFRNITGGVLVSSDGGNTVIQGSAFVDLELMAIGSVSSGGVMLLKDGIVDGGVFEVRSTVFLHANCKVPELKTYEFLLARRREQNGFVVMQGSSLVVDSAHVSRLHNLQGSMFLADGDGSTVQVTNLTMTANDIRSTPSTWSGIRASDGAILSVNDAHFLGNYQMRSVITIYGGSRADVDRVTVSNATGTGAVDTLVSSVVAIDGVSTATVRRVSIDDVTDFTTSIFVNEGSTALISQTCLNSGSTQGAVYVSEDSTFSGSSNYVNDLLYETLAAPVACPGPGNRLIKEQPGSSCFKGSPCTTECREFGGESVCMAQSTLPPSSAPAAITASLAQATAAPTPVLADQSTPGPTPTSGTFAPSLLRSPQPTPTSGTFAPTNQPTPTSGTWTPTFAGPSANPANTTTFPPTLSPTVSPRPTVSALPSQSPTISSMPSSSPSSLPSASPTVSPMPSASPSAAPSTSSPPPSNVPSGFPSQRPSGKPSESPRPSATPSGEPSGFPSANPSTKPTELQRTLAPSASGTRQPQCDCRTYWYGPTQYESPGYLLGYTGYNGGGVAYYGSNRYSPAPKAKSMKGSKRWRERRLSYYNGAGFVKYDYDPCCYYCRWVLHNSYAFNRAYGNNGNYAGP